MIIKINGGTKNEVVRFEREMVDIRRIPGSKEPNKIKESIDDTVRDDTFIRQRNHADGTYVLISNFDVVEQLARLSKDYAALQEKLAMYETTDSGISDPGYNEAA